MMVCFEVIDFELTARDAESKGYSPYCTNGCDSTTNSQDMIECLREIMKLLCPQYTGTPSEAPSPHEARSLPRYLLPSIKKFIPTSLCQKPSKGKPTGRCSQTPLCQQGIRKYANMHQRDSHKPTKPTSVIKPTDQISKPTTP